MQEGRLITRGCKKNLLIKTVKAGRRRRRRKEGELQKKLRTVFSLDLLKWGGSFYRWKSGLNFFGSRRMLTQLSGKW